MRWAAALVCVLLIGSACGGTSSSEIEALERRIEELEDDQTATSTTTSAVASTTLPVSTTTSAASTTTAPPTTAVEVTTTTTEAPTPTTTTEPPLTCVGWVGLCQPDRTVSESLIYINDPRLRDYRGPYGGYEVPQEAIWRPLGPCEWEIEWGLFWFRSEHSSEIEVHLGLGKHTRRVEYRVMNRYAQKFAAIDPKAEYLFADSQGYTYGVYRHVFTAEDLWSGGLEREYWIAQDSLAPFVGVFKVFEDGSIDEFYNLNPFVVAVYAGDDLYRETFGNRDFDARIYLDLEDC